MLDELRAQLEAEASATARACADCALAAAREVDATLHLADVERHLAAEKDECQQTRDLLVAQRRDMEHFKGAHIRDMAAITARMTAAHSDGERMRTELAQLRRALSELGVAGEARMREADVTLRRALHDADSLRTQLDSANTVRHQVALRNKQLEGDLRNLRRQMARASVNSAKSHVESVDRSEVDDTAQVKHCHRRTHSDLHTEADWVFISKLDRI